MKLMNWRFFDIAQRPASSSTEDLHQQHLHQVIFLPQPLLDYVLGALHRSLQGAHK
jgi:hypothetical protein